MAVSAKGFQGVGPVFRVDTTVDGDGIPHNQPGTVSDCCLRPRASGVGRGWSLSLWRVNLSEKREPMSHNTASAVCVCACRLVS